MQEQNNKVWNIEKIDAYIESLEVEAPKLKAARVNKLQSFGIEKLLDILADVCVVITTATPVLKWVRKLLFFRPKWQKVIDQITGVTDEVCGGEAPDA